MEPVEGCPRLLRRLRIPLLILLVVAVLATLTTFIIRTTRPSCKDVQAKQDCCNSTSLLEHQLTKAQEDQLQRKAQVTACNKTVETLMASLEKEKSRSQVREKNLQEKIQNLQQQLQEASTEVEKLRKEKEEWGQYPKTSSISSLVTLSPMALAALLLLDLWAVWT
ncbi:bone marrow stromal antigen 2-like [Talpa occidentalis]|uniref:bone marrow stromal antigen 2-like n=1 Tax=Talpa occidentalis TaxID=50954 RepID=UPI0023F8F900|nr:bone marrow stromal antigen 2-like [Talpa occidentalis]